MLSLPAHATAAQKADAAPVDQLTELGFKVEYKNIEYGTHYAIATMKREDGEVRLTAFNLERLVVVALQVWTGLHE
jgi:hypothetical protein